MLRRIEPEVGAWYEHTDLQTLFEVVFIDDEGENIGIQYFDGEIEELELDAFIRMPLCKVDQPEDWSGPYEMDNDDIFENDFGDFPPGNHTPALSDEYESAIMHILDE
ncbi:MAG: DUF6763 family protein [Ketobacter sp.]